MQPRTVEVARQLLDKKDKLFGYIHSNTTQGNCNQWLI